MAEERSKIIIEVGLDPKEYAQRAKTVAKSIDELKKEQQELRKAGQQNSVQYVENAEKLKVLGRELKANITLSKNAGDSNKGLRSQLSLLTEQYNSLSQEQRENTEEGKRLTAQIKSISDQLKGNEGAIGDNRRKVGSYKEAVGGLEGQLAELTLSFEKLSKTERKSAEGKEIIRKIEEVTTELKKQRTALEEAERAQAKAESQTRSYSSGLSDLVAEHVPLLNQMKSSVTTVGLLTKGIGGTNIALKAFKIALISTGVGAIVVALGSLLALLAKNQKAIDFVNQVMAGLGATVRVLVDRLATLGGAIVKLFKGDFKGAVTDFKSSVTGLGAEIASEAGAAAKMEGELIKVRRAQEALNVERAKSRAEIERLKFVSEDQSKSESERQAAAQKAFALENGLLQKQIGLKQKELNLTKERNDQGKRTDAQLKEEQELEIQLAEIKEESFGKQTELNNKVNELNRARAERAKAAAEEERKAFEEADQARIESLQRTNDMLLTERQREIEETQRHFDELIEKYGKYSDTVEALERERTRKLEEIRDEFHEEDLKAIEENLREIQDIQIAAIEDNGQRELAALRVQGERRIQAQEEVIAELRERIESGEQGLTEVLQSELNLRASIEADNLRQRNELRKQLDQEDLKQQEEAILARLEAEVTNAQDPASRLMAEQAYIEQKYQYELEAAELAGQEATAIKARHAEQIRKIDQDTAQAGVDAFTAFGSAFQDIVGGNAKAAKVANTVIAKIQQAQIARQAVQNAINSIGMITEQAKQPFPFNIIAIASTIATVGAAISAVKKLVTPPKLAKGGLVGGKPHSQGGTKYYGEDGNVFEAEAGEVMAVVNKKNAPLLGLLSAVNSFRGNGVPFGRSTGAKFAAGGIFDGGTSTGFITQNVDRAQEVSQTTAAIMQNFPPIVVGVKEVISKVGQVQNVQGKITI